jgi:predicted nucleotide-binding protein
VPNQREFVRSGRDCPTERVEHGMTTRPRMFIGSSREGLAVAQPLQAELEHDVDATIWSQGVFGLTTGTLEALVEEMDRFEFATIC